MDTPLPGVCVCVLFVIVNALSIWFHFNYSWLWTICTFNSLEMQKCTLKLFYFSFSLSVLSSVVPLAASQFTLKFEKVFSMAWQFTFFRSSIWTWNIQYHNIPSHSLKLESPSVWRLPICKSDRQVNKERCVLILFVFSKMACPVSRKPFKSFLFLMLRFYFPLNVALGSRRLATIVFCLSNCFYRKLIHNLHIATEKNHNLTPFPYTMFIR